MEIMAVKSLKKFQSVHRTGIAAFLAATGFVFSASAQTTTVSTTPVGYLTAAIPASPDGVNPSNTVVSVPLYSTAVYAGAITSVDSSTSFSSGSAAWATNQFTASPTLVRIKTGANTGRNFLITANTATQLTVNTDGFDLTQLLSVNNTFEIIPANTLGSLFGTNSVQFQTASTASGADNLLLFNGASWDIYYNNGTNWKKSGSLNNQNNTVIYPDEAIFIERFGLSSLSLTFMGVVPSGTERTDLPGPGYAFMANRFPTDTTIASFGLQALSGWQSGASASGAGDNLEIFNGTNWDVYYYNGTNWKKSGSLLTQDSTTIPAGSAVFILRQSSASGTSATLVQNLPYALN